MTWRGDQRFAFGQTARRFLLLRRDVAVAEREMKGLKADLVAAVAAHGTAEEAGHLIVELDEPYLGCSALRNVRRDTVDAEAADRVCSAHRIVEDCSTTWIAFARPDKVLAFLRKTAEGARLLEGSGDRNVVYERSLLDAAHRAGTISDAELDEIVVPTWALTPVKAAGA